MVTNFLHLQKIGPKELHLPLASGKTNPPTQFLWLMRWVLGAKATFVPLALRLQPSRGPGIRPWGKCGSRPCAGLVGSHHMGLCNTIGTREQQGLHRRCPLVSPNTAPRSCLQRFHPSGNTLQGLNSSLSSNIQGPQHFSYKGLDSRCVFSFLGHTSHIGSCFISQLEAATDVK